MTDWAHALGEGYAQLALDYQVRSAEMYRNTPLERAYRIQHAGGFARFAWAPERRKLLPMKDTEIFYVLDDQDCVHCDPDGYPNQDMAESAAVSAPWRDGSDLHVVSVVRKTMSTIRKSIETQVLTPSQAAVSAVDMQKE